MEWKPPIIQDPSQNLFKIPERWVYLRYYEAFNLLFRIENGLRVFVYSILKNEFRDKWPDIQISTDESTSSSIAAIAKRRMAQAKNYGYLGHSISCPIMHLTSGELTRLIVDDAYWKLFNSCFKGSKEIIRSKLEEIGTIRNSLAHFRPIKDDDVAAVKHNAKHILMGVEQYLNQVLMQPDIVPTNTEDDWYKRLKIIKSDLCTLSFSQSADSCWIRIRINFRCPILSTYKWMQNQVNYDVLNIDSSAVLRLFPDITSAVTYLSEWVPFLMMPDNANPPSFSKDLFLVLTKDTLAAHVDKLEASLTKLLTTITEQSALIQQDHLARGQIIQAVRIIATAYQVQSATNWTVDTARFRTAVKPEDPPEYWGPIWGFPGDFIAQTPTYPWMPEAISKPDFSF
jgi:hypothetical protein